MQAFQGMAWLLVLQLTEEAMAHMFNLPFPDLVIGMLLLVGVLWLASREAHFTCSPI